MKTPLSYANAKQLANGAITPPVRRIYVEATGDIEFTTPNGQTVTLTAVAQGVQLDVEIKTLGAGTTATLVGFW